MLYRHLSRAFAVAACLAAASMVLAAPQAQNPDNEPNLTEEQKIDFLLHAKVVASRQIGVGETALWRLTLRHGTLTHDAAFQSIESVWESPVYHEIQFRVSYHFDIAAWELARLLGLDDMVPVTVERKWGGKRGSLSWWLPYWKMDFDRIKEKLQPPDIEAWNRQMYRVRVFGELLFDAGRNLDTVLITKDWKIWRLDFAPAFGPLRDLRHPKDLVQCDRQLLEKLRQLSYDMVLEKTKPHLTEGEVKALMTQRDKIVAYFEKLIAEKGEPAVLY